MKPTDLDRPVMTAIAADPTYHGWQIVEDVIGVDPYLLCEWIREGASATLYRFDAGDHTAWAYRSRTHGGWLAADTTDNQSYVCTGPMDAVTLQVAARLAGDEINRLFETVPAYRVHPNPALCPQSAGQFRPTPAEARL